MAAGPARYLITIGVPDQDIPNVGKSVELVADCLTARGYRRALCELANLQPREELKLKLSCWARGIDKEDIAILYFAGHGGTIKQRHYLGLPETDWSLPDATALASEDLFRSLAAGPNLMNLLVILDTCYSGQVALDAQRLADVLQGDEKNRAFWVVTASYKKQEASDGGFAAAFHKRVLETRGAALRRYELSTLVKDLKSDLPPFQTAGYVGIGLMSDEPPDFLPNPDFISTGLLDHPIEDRHFFHDDLLQHWRPRAMGSEAIFQSGQWYFTGRTAALQCLVAWLNSPTGDGKGFIITGDPGCGKSALLGYLAVASDQEQTKQPVIEKFLASMPPATRPAPGSITFALALRGKTLIDVKNALAARFDTKPEEVLTALATLDELTVLMFDALDESAAPEEIADRLLRPLTGYAHLKIVVGARRPQIKNLGQHFNQIDLDLPAYRSNADIAQYVQRILLAEGETRMTPYRGRPDQTGPVAAAVAERANGNYLVARTIARSLMERDTVVDLTHEQIPRSVPEAFADYLKASGERSGLGEWPLREALIPLAYTKGQGLPLDIWQHFSPISVIRTLDVAAAFISEYVEDGRTVYRLYHQALADALQDPKLDSERQRTMAQVLYQAIPEGDWLRADWYTRKYFSLYAAAGAVPLLEQSTLDVRFLATANLPLLLSASHVIESTESKRRSNWLKLASCRLNDDEGDRLANLGLVAMQNHAPDLAALCRQVVQRRNWRPKWVRWSRQLTPHRVLPGDTGNVNSVAAAEGIVVSGSDDYTVRFWNAITGQPIGGPVRHDNKVISVAVGAGVAISGGWDDTVRFWDARTAKPKGEPLTGHTNRVLAVAIGGGLAASGDASGDLFLWDVETLTGIGCPVRVSGGPIRALAIAGGIVAAGCEDGSVRFYNRDGKPALASLAEPGEAVTALAIAEGTLAVIYNYRVLRRWRMPACSVIGEPLPLDTLVNAIAIGDGLMALGCGDFSVRLVDVETGQYKASPLVGHTLFVTCVAIDEDLIVSGASDGTVRVWDVAVPEPIGKSDSAIERGLGSVAITDDLVVTAGREQQLKSWDLNTGESKAFSGKCYTADGGAPLVAAGDGFIAFNGGPVAISILNVKSGAMASLPGDYRIARSLAIAQGVLVSVGVDRALRRWDLGTLQPIGNPVFLDASASALAIAGDGIIWTSGNLLQSWDLRTASARGDASKEREGISSLAVHGNVLVSGHWNGLVKTRDASNGQNVRSGTSRPQSRVNCVALYKNWAISGSPAGNLYVWNLTTMNPIFEIELGSPVNDLIATPDGICVACADGVVSLELNL